MPIQCELERQSPQFKSLKRQLLTVWLGGSEFTSRSLSFHNFKEKNDNNTNLMELTKHSAWHIACPQLCWRLSSSLFFRLFTTWSSGDYFAHLLLRVEPGRGLLLSDLEQVTLPLWVLGSAPIRAGNKNYKSLRVKPPSGLIITLLPQSRTLPGLPIK